MTVADNPQSAMLTALDATGFRVDTPPGRFVVASPEGTFLRLLFQEQPAAPEGSSFGVSDPFEPLGNAQAAGVEMSAPKPFLSALRMASVEPGTTPKRKKASTETDTGALALAPQFPDMSKAARWILSLTSYEAPATCPSPSSVSELAAQQLTASSETSPSEQRVAAPSLSLADRALAAPDLPVELTATRDGAAKVATGAITTKTADIAPFAELALTPSADPIAASRMKTPKPVSAVVPLLEPAHTRLSEGTEVSSQFANAPESSNISAVRPRDLGLGSGSSPDSSSDRPKLAPAAPKKKDEAGGAQGENFAIPLNSRTGGQVVVSPALVPDADESQRVPNSPEPTDASRSVPEATLKEALKPAGSSVGTIELQVKSPDRSSVGLRFVERQGRVEIQMKSGDQQTAREISEHLGGLKTTLNETGWEVESRIQTPIASVGQASQTEATAARGLSPILQQVFTNLSTRFSLDSTPTSADRSGSSLLPPTEQVPNAQFSRQSGSDSYDQSRTDRNDTSDKNGQQGRNDNASADSGGQGRRSARDSEAWLESMESNLTRSSSVRVTTGVTK